MDYVANGSPINARANVPIFPFILLILLLIALIVVIWFISKVITNYYNSSEYKEKQKNRLTTLKDIKNICEANKIQKEEGDLLWQICKKYKIPNFSYIIKDSNQITEIFRKTYFDFLAENVSAQVMNLFFKLQFSLEVASAQTKKYISTRQIPLETMLMYIAPSGEQYPFTLVINTKDYFSLEIPTFFFNLKEKPEVLERLRFNFRSTNGLSHSFVSRLMRYQKMPENKIYMNLTHSENLVTASNRHFKRKMFDEKCYFYPVKTSGKENSKDATYQISDKQYEGQLANISGGGCCIKTKLPILENQHIAVVFPNITGEQKMIGIIKGTRKLPDQRFALHIQFKNITIECQNKVLAYVYKYHL